MNAETGASDAALPPHGRLEGRSSFDAMLRWALAHGPQQPQAVWWWCDADFADWPLGERGVIEALQAWAAGGRRLRLLAHDYRTLQRVHPRFVAWRQTWDHLVEARACRHLAASDTPSVMWSGDWAFQRLDVERGVVVCGDDVGLRTRLGQSLDALWARSSPAFPASTLGL